MSSFAPFPEGFSHHPLYFDAVQQAGLIDLVRGAIEVAPFFQPRMPGTGQPTSVIMSNFGPLGWVAGQDGYRYQLHHPITDQPWPDMPNVLLDLWHDVTDYPHPPECCLINWYRDDRDAKMGYHVDNDEQAVNAPIVSVSLGDPATYRLGHHTRGGKTWGVKLLSGDVIVLQGDSRQRHHAVTKVFWGESAVVPKGGRINLTMRRVSVA